MTAQHDALIHPTAIIADSACLHESVRVGPYSVIGNDVSIGEGTVVKSHVVIARNTRIGKHNTIFQFASIGEDCQDLKYNQEETWLEIGDNNRIREACSFHRGTAQDKGVTKIGSDNLFMVNTHIAHDCVIGNHNVFANNVGIAGHVQVGDYVIVGGNSGIHQFCRIDSYSLIGGASLILKDVAAYTMVSGNPSHTHGLNIEGMRRKGWSKETISILRDAAKRVFKLGLTKVQAIEQLQKELLPLEPKVQLLIDSLQNSQRGIVR